MEVSATRLNAAGKASRAAKDGLEALKAFIPNSSGGSIAKAAILTEAEAAFNVAEAEYEAALTEWEIAEMRRLSGLPPAPAPEPLAELLP